MKNFVIKSLEKFLEIADTIESPFKFYEVIRMKKGNEDIITITASVWIRTAFISWEKSTSFEKELLEAIEHLSKHGFVETEIRETPLVIK
ncbi:MAG: hypothetical protein QXG39_10100 [Candidatus Aenigmatarchaeota archaeon]